MKRFIDNLSVCIYVAHKGVVALAQGLVATICLLMPIYVILAVHCKVWG